MNEYIRQMDCELMQIGGLLDAKGNYNDDDGNDDNYYDGSINEIAQCQRLWNRDPARFSLPRLSDKRHFKGMLAVGAPLG